MGAKAFVNTFLLGIIGFSIFAQEPDAVITWDSNRPLTWNDFKGPIPPDDVAAATTASGITYRYSANLMHHEVALSFEVEAHFYPDQSWYKPTLCDDHVLGHEQLHFDITELFARKMKRKLQQTTFSDNVKSEIQKIYREIIRELKDWQEQYDWETNFSREKEAQRLWNQKIKALLQQFPK